MILPCSYFNISVIIKYFLSGFNFNFIDKIYLFQNYIPELMRDDIPQALRGQRNVVFGNIEKIYEFHNQYFLTELEHCENNPFIVGQCFLDFVSIYSIDILVIY